MTDLDQSRTESAGNEKETISNAIKKGLEVEAIEVRVARGILEEELTEGFENSELTFILDKDPIRIFNKGYHDDTLAYDDKDFNLEEEGVTLVDSNDEGINVKESHSLYERSDLKEPRTGKIFRIDHMVYNHAYFPFNSREAGLVEEQRQREMSIIPDFVDTDYSSAFDKTFDTSAKKESLSVGFDGYIFIFSRFAHSNGSEHIELEIEQYKREDSEGRKCIRKSNVVEGLGPKEFLELKNAILEKVKTAKPKASV